VSEWSIFYPTRISRIAFRLGWRRSHFETWIKRARNKSSRNMLDRFVLRHFVCIFDERNIAPLNRLTDHISTDLS